MSTENQSAEITQSNQTKKSFMCKPGIGTIVNVALFVGLIVLYVLNFAPLGRHNQQAGGGRGSDSLQVGANLRIAFVNSDSLMEHYQLALNMRNELEAERNRMENDFQRRERNFQTELENFQRQIQSNTITMENAQRKEQELMRLRDELIQLNEEYTATLMNKELEMNQDLYGRIRSFLEIFSKEEGYDYILGFADGGGILYASQRHDITQTVLERLNSELEAGN